MMLLIGGDRLFFATAAILILSVLPSSQQSLRVHAELLSEPLFKWSLQLEGSGRLKGRGLRKGNALVAYNDKLLVTANDGSLHIIQTTVQVKTLAVFVPDEIEGRFTACQSGPTVVDKQTQGGLFIDGITAEEESNIFDGASDPVVATHRNVTFGVDVGEEDYIIYSVVDVTEAPPGSAGINVDGILRESSISSRVLAVKFDGNFKWSVEVRGRIEGNPVVGKTGIYVSHNKDGIGYLSVIRIDPITGTAKIVATVSPPATESGINIPFGPPALQQQPYWSYDENLNDVVVVAESWDRGFSEDQGGLYVLALISSAGKKGSSDQKSESSASTFEYQLQKVSSWSYSAIAPPLVYGDSVFLGAAGGNLAGFTKDRKNDLSGIVSGREVEISPRWDFQVTPNPRNPSQRKSFSCFIISLFLLFV